jgi:hypothetical protein
MILEALAEVAVMALILVVGMVWTGSGRRPVARRRPMARRRR